MVYNPLLRVFIKFDIGLKYVHIKIRIQYNGIFIPQYWYISVGMEGNFESKGSSEGLRWNPTLCERLSKVSVS